MFNNQTGLLLSERDIKLHRKWFEEMVRLMGIQVIHRAPKDSSKHYTLNTEIISNNYADPVIVGCIFNEHPDQHTMKKLGWVSELQEDASLINVPYDTVGLQQGSLFIVPSGVDNSQGRVFRVVDMVVGIIYPAAITCKIVPEYEDTFDREAHTYKHSSFNLLNEGN